jgi:predicted RNA-binding protein with TRAM domain
LSYRRDTRRTSNFLTPVEIGKEYTVDITDTGRSGDGIARITGFVIFVKNTKAGDKNVKIKIKSIGQLISSLIDLLNITSTNIDTILIA